MKEFYEKHVTDESLKELVCLANWYNEKIGHYPVIIGGWAVYSYTQGLGSKDIDIVFPGDITMDATLQQYFNANGYKKRKIDIITTEFYKEVKSSEGHMVEILIDATSASKSAHVTDTGVTIPYSLALNRKYQKKQEIGKGIFIYIPIAELLLTYKLGAVLGRSNLSRSMPESDYIRTKALKDIYDVLTVFESQKIDIRLLKKFMTDSGLIRYFTEINEIIISEQNPDFDLHKKAYLDKTKGLLK